AARCGGATEDQGAGPSPAAAAPASTLARHPRRAGSAVTWHDEGPRDVERARGSALTAGPRQAREPVSTGASGKPVVTQIESGCPAPSWVAAPPGADRDARASRVAVARGVPT